MNGRWLFCLGLLLCVSCETIEITKEKYSCNQLDWFEIGRSDAIQGLPSDHFDKSNQTCESFTEDHKQRYITGWYSGQDEYCTPENGFAMGRSGRALADTCPRSKKASFLGAYQKGVQVMKTEAESQRLNVQLQALQQEEVNSGFSTQELIRKKSEIEAQLELNRALISSIQAEIRSTQPQSL